MRSLATLHYFLLAIVVAFAACEITQPSASRAIAQSDTQPRSTAATIYREALAALESGDADGGLELLHQAVEAGEIRALILARLITDDSLDSLQDEPDSVIAASVAEIADLPDEDLGRRVFDLGMADLGQDGQVRDPAAAVALFEAAADAGYAPALVQLGTIYLNGHGVEPDAGRAINYLEQAVAAGEVWALVELGKAYRDGVGVEADASRAIAYLERASQAGADWALVELGMAYRDGMGVDMDPDLARAYFEQAADAGVAWALVELGKMYRDGVGAEPDADRALAYFEQAADAGVTWALVELGTSYRDGLGFEPDFDRAVGYFERAVEAGVTWARIELGAAYRDRFGDGSDTDFARALEQFEEAADAGNAVGALEVLRTLISPDKTTTDGVTQLIRYLEADFGDQGEWLLWLFDDLNNNERVVLLQMLLTASDQRVTIDGILGRETIDAIREICRRIRSDHCPGTPLHVDTVVLLRDATRGSESSAVGVSE